MRTRVRNRIHHLIDGQTEQIRAEAVVFKDLFGKKGRQWLKTVQLPVPDQSIFWKLVKLEEYLSKQVQHSDSAIAKLFKSDSNSQLISSIPGFGTFLSVLTSVEIGDINRFRSASRLASYAGLVPSTYSSGGHTWHGRIHKQGNKWLRWAFVEAAIHASATKGDLRAFYFRIKRRKGTKTARVATGRKLCLIVFRILVEQKSYQIFIKSRSHLQSVNSVS